MYSTYSHVTSIRLWSNLTNQWCRCGLRKLLDRFRSEALSESVLALVEALVQYNAGLGHTLSLRQRLVRRRTEQEAIPQLLCHLGKGSITALVVLVEVSHHHNLVRRLELLERFAGAEYGDRRHALLGHIGDNGLRLARALVGRHVFGAAEDLEGRVALDAIFLAEILLGGAVDLCELDGFVFEAGRGFFVLGGKGFAVAAPGCEDLSIALVVVFNKGN